MGPFGKKKKTTHKHTEKTEQNSPNTHKNQLEKYTKESVVRTRNYYTFQVSYI